MYMVFVSFYRNNFVATSISYIENLLFHITSNRAF